MSTDGQGTKRYRKIAENFNSLSIAHERYRQTDTTDRRTGDSSSCSLKMFVHIGEYNITFTGNFMFALDLHVVTFVRSTQRCKYAME